MHKYIFTNKAGTQIIDSLVITDLFDVNHVSAGKRAADHREKLETELDKVIIGWAELG